ncbi:MAG: LysM domain-containing protein [bacterium]|nr:LysM domain-containing protein [bacterium]MDY4098672.1 LysM domain-containing protein [Lachnospiraceae bacterium]
MENSMTDRSTKDDKQRLQLPKNIRQIGNIQGAVRIYMEDYVYTYLHGNAKSGWAHRGSVFLGSRCQENGQKYIFISGLVHIPDECFQEGIPEFTDLMWSSVYQDMKQFYENVEILGWGMDVAGASAKLTGDLERIHRNAFQGQDKLLFLMDTIEKEEAFYVNEKNMLRRRDGYYIYYEKNPQMQEYMMKGKEEPAAQPEIDPQRAVVSSYRTITAEKNKKGSRGFQAFVYVASLALLAAVSAMGVNLMSSAGKIHRLEEAVSYLQADQTDAEQEQQSVQTEEASVLQENEAAGNETATEESDPEYADEEDDPLLQTESELSGADLTGETAEEGKTEEQAEEAETADEEEKEEQEPEKKEEDQPEEEPLQETAAFAEQDYYIVEKGESLLGISQKIYGKDYTKQLCALNGLEDENKIYAGQKLLLLDK